MSFINELHQRGIFIDEDGKWYTHEQMEILEGLKNDNHIEMLELMKQSYSITNAGRIRPFNNIVEYLSNIKSEDEWIKLLGLKYVDPVPKFDYDDMGLLDIADMALAFMSPISAARYIIKKIRE